MLYTIMNDSHRNISSQLFQMISFVSCLLVIAIYLFIRVFLGTDKKKIIERLKYEMLALLTAKEDDVATTLLMLPFAYQNFEVRRPC